MKQTEIKQKSLSKYLYVALLIATLLPVSYVDNISKNNIGLRLTTILFLINLYFFIKVRKSRHIQTSGDKIYTLASASISIWFFLHCLLYVNPSLGENILNIFSIMGFNIQFRFLNYESFSFFLANLFCLIMAIIEMIKSPDKFVKSIYLIGIIFTSYIILNYILFHNKILFLI